MANCRLFWSLVSLLISSVFVHGRPFTILVYNVENLFDADGVAVYDDYKPSVYTPMHMRTKLVNIARVVSQVDEGRGPDVILFQEIEVDRTPDHEPSAETRLLAVFNTRGLTGYTVVVGSDSADKPHEDGNQRAIKCALFTRFPVKAVRNHPTLTARNILEVELEVDGSKLYVFNNHWKSGASDPATESIRLANARTLRARIDQILKGDPNADIVLGGDFNSQYNQSRRYGTTMRETGINDVLKSQGNELAVRSPQRDLYNLWFELPVAGRGSDTFRGEWGTLMQLIISRGLYDQRGVQYVDNSFGVLKVKGLNSTDEGTPVRWSNEGPAGSGFSDHFPIYARFTTVKDNRPERWIALTRPSPSDDSPTQAIRLPERGVDFAKAVALSRIPDAARLRDGSFTGKLIQVEGRVGTGPRLILEALNDTWDVWVPDPTLRDELRARWKAGDNVSFYGILGLFKGRWQFVIEKKEWVHR